MIYLMFMIGLIPILFVFVVFSYLMGRAAKKFGRSPWLWGAASFVLLITIFWRQMPSWAAYIFYKGAVAMQAAEPKKPVITLAEARTVNYHVSVDNVGFDVPLSYDFRGFNQKLKGWPGSTKEQIENGPRQAVDFINVYALLPDLAPMSDENVPEFEVLGWGRQIIASLTHVRTWDYYFKNTFPRTEPRPESADVRGMLHYYDPMARSDLYFDHINASTDVTRIWCDDQNFFHHKSPACKIETFYRPAPDIIASEHIEGAVFWLEYSLPLQYLSQWRETDQKLKSLFDQFVRSAAQHHSSAP